MVKAFTKEVALTSVMEVDTLVLVLMVEELVPAKVELEELEEELEEQKEELQEQHKQLQDKKSKKPSADYTYVWLFIVSCVLILITFLS